MGRKILLVTADQQRHDALGCNGGKIARTPVIDGLARDGINYKRAHNQNVVCMPARATIISGQHVRTHGVRMNGIPLPEDTPDIARLLKEQAGYKTALIGKAHFEPASAPGAPYFENYAASKNHTGPHRGFDRMELSGHTGRSGRSLFHYPKWLEETSPGAAESFQEYVSPEKEISGKPGGDTGAVQVWHNTVPKELYHTNWVAERTINWLDSLEADVDWFCWMSFPDPHHPWDPPISEITRCNWRDLELPDAFPGSVEDTIKILEQKPRHWLDWYLGHKQFAYEVPKNFVPAQMSTDQIREVNAMCHIENELIDEALGRVLGHINERGWGEDVDVIYTADHGEFQGDFGMLFKGPYHVDALMRLPMIWRPAPSAKIPSAIINQPVGHVDIARTIADVAGVKADPRMQGAPLPTSSSNDRERVITEWDGGYAGESVTLRTLCRDNYVLTVCEPGSVHDGSEGELYDLENDPRQFHNLWDDTSRGSLKRDLIADLYDNLPEVRDPPLDQVALV
jgi:arylsulfatase A-like enzyme